MTRTIHVLGSDTGVGKTWVCAHWLRSLRGFGVCKPFETGVGPGTRQASDGARLAAASGQPLDVVAPWTFPNPVCAAEELLRTGTVVSVDDVRAAIERATGSDGVIVEWAGGAMSPVLGGLTCLDLACELGGEIVVVRDRLGAINQAALVATAVLGRGLSPIVVLNRHSGDSEPFGDHTVRWLREIRGFGELRILRADETSADLP